MVNYLVLFSSSQMKLPKAILFDHDGVLVASEPLHWAAWSSLLRELGMPDDLPGIQSQVGKTSYQILASLLDAHRPGWVSGKGPGEYDLEALGQRKNDFYLKAMKQDLQPYPAVRETLEWLRDQGIKLAVVSNARARELEAALHGLNLHAHFHEVISRDQMAQPKPDPGAYLLGAASVGIEPADCLVVEDSPPGIESGLLGGIPCAAILTNFPRSAMEQPVPGRPDLRPVWIGPTFASFFTWLKELPR
jgi:HAD superfamily hydrolase (TIGR01509 family)